MKRPQKLAVMLVPTPPYEICGLAGLLLKALRYESPKMPPDGKLADSVIEDFVRWIAMGAPDPRENAPGLSASKSEGALKNPLDHWAYRLVERSAEAYWRFGCQLRC